MNSSKANIRTHSVNDLIQVLGDSVLEIRGDKSRIFSVVKSLREAGSDALTFCKHSGIAATDVLMATKASVVICGKLDQNVSLPIGTTFVETIEPRKAFVLAVAAFFTPVRPCGTHPTAVISPNAKVDPTAYIGPYVVLDDCEVGANSVIHANVVIHSGSRIGMNVTINAGTVVGSDGFGYERTADGTMIKFIHLGGVVIEDDVEIGTNTSIDRGTLGDTIIERGVKIDNQVHIAHNCHIKEHAVVIAQCMVGGSVTIGARSWIAPGVVLMNGISIGADSYCGLGAVVTKSVKNGETVMGNPARPIDEAKALLAAQKSLLKN